MGKEAQCACGWGLGVLQMEGLARIYFSKEVACLLNLRMRGCAFKLKGLLLQWL